MVSLQCLSALMGVVTLYVGIDYLGIEWVSNEVS